MNRKASEKSIHSGEKSFGKTRDQKPNGHQWHMAAQLELGNEHLKDS